MRWIPKGTENVILVEGATEVTVVRGIIQARGYDHLEAQTEILNIEGISRLKESLETLNRESEWKRVKRLAVIADADDNAEKRMQEIQEISEDLKPRKSNILYFVSPNGKDSGEIERMLWDSAQNTGEEGVRKNSCEKFIQETFSLLKAKVDREWKRYIRAFAATDKHNPTEPTHRLAKKWNFTHRAFDPLANILETMNTESSGGK